MIIDLAKERYKRRPAIDDDRAFREAMAHACADIGEPVPEVGTMRWAVYRAVWLTWARR